MLDAILNFLPYVLYILAAIMILVFVHEMGHFLAAKLFGMRVEKFSVGFPPKVIGRKIGDTEYVIGATPLGGYVKIAGMVDESLDTENLASEPQPWEFRAKPVWQRIVVITAGVIFNMILAWVIFTALKLSYGELYVPAENVRAVYVADGSPAARMGLRTGDRIVAVGEEPLERYDDLVRRVLFADPLTVTVERAGARQTLNGPPDIITQLGRAGNEFGVSAEPALAGAVLEDSPAHAAGLRAGDRIVAVGGQPVRFWSEMLPVVQRAGGRAVPVRFERPDSLVAASGAVDTAAVRLVATSAGARVYETAITPRKAAGDSLFRIGVGGPTAAQRFAVYGVRERSFGLFEAMGQGIAATGGAVKGITTSLGRVFTGRDALRENLGGPIKVAQIVREEADRGGAPAFWGLVAMLSVTLAVMNILPIPALDGGHLVFLLWEGITRREPSLKVRMALQQVGMAVLLLFMAFLFINDITRFF